MLDDQREQHHRLSEVRADVQYYPMTYSLYFLSLLINSDILSDFLAIANAAEELQ